MKVQLVSIPVADQESAMQFYTKKLGFVIKNDIPMGGGNRWLTLVSPEDLEGTEVLLEPAIKHFEPAKVFQKAVYDAGMPYTQFYSDNIEEEVQRLKNRGVEFSLDVKDVGTAIVAIFDDTCGNRIQLVQEK